MRLDCDRDTLLVRAQPAGPICHTGAATCFFSDGDGGAPASALDALARVIAERKRVADAESSYTRALLDAGPPRIAAKIVEEAGELAVEVMRGNRERIVAECADLFYHALVGLGAHAIDPGAVMAELARRFGTSGIEEKQSRRQRKRVPKRKRKK
jgi:phosphoribosyl-ATP pyrophosphohydrolase/phosphoribosyl-AMP cyclohydrolase